MYISSESHRDCLEISGLPYGMLSAPCVNGKSYSNPYLKFHTRNGEQLLHVLRVGVCMLLAF